MPDSIEPQIMNSKIKEKIDTFKYGVHEFLSKLIAFFQLFVIFYLKNGCEFSEPELQRAGI